MQSNRWTLALYTLGLISLAALTRAEEQTSLLTALSATTISGYVDTSAIWLFDTGNSLVGRSFDGPDKQDGFNLNVVKLQLEKPLDDSGWAAGYTVGLLFGPDANTLASASSGEASSDFAVKNACVTLRAPVGNGLTFKAGVWDTLVGYEVLEAGNNPNYSRSFGYYIEPIIHTGLLASYPVANWLSLSAGVADRGDANSINSRAGIESLKTYLGSFTLTAPESYGVLRGATLTGGIVDSGVAGAKDWVNLYLGATLPTPVKGLGLGVAYDYRANALFDGSYENALAAYLNWQATGKLKVNGRVDYATGSRSAYGVPEDANHPNVRLLGLTATLDYSLWANVISRAEIRWDHSLTGQGFLVDGTRENACSLALNVIYKF